MITRRTLKRPVVTLSPAIVGTTARTDRVKVFSPLAQWTAFQWAKLFGLMMRHRLHQGRRLRTTSQEVSTSCSSAFELQADSRSQMVSGSGKA